MLCGGIAQVPSEIIELCEWRKDMERHWHCRIGRTLRNRNWSARDDVEFARYLEWMRAVSQDRHSK